MKMASVLSGATTMLPFMRLNEGFFDGRKNLLGVHRRPKAFAAFVRGRCLASGSIWTSRNAPTAFINVNPGTFVPWLNLDKVDCVP